MGALTRVIGGLLLVAGVLGAREAAAQQTLPLKPLMLGAARMPDVKNAEGRVPRPAIWHREMARQAFLIAAREEFGLPTRDLILGEAVDLQDPLCFLPVVTSHYVTGTVITITQSGKEIYKNTAKTTGNRTRHYMGELVWEEEQSRTGYAEALARLGYQRRANPDFNQRLLPPDAAELLSRMNEISQFAAVRRIHQEISEHGESPPLLSGLARGYAHLTQLMMPVPDNMYGVFGARAMLYAQRLLTRLPNDPHSHLTRAYVMAWVGLPNQTEADLKKAQELGAAPDSWPQWAKLADLYWRARFVDLSRIVRDENATEREAAAILMFRIVRMVNSELLVTETGNLALTVCPDNLFILWHMAYRGGQTTQWKLAAEVVQTQTKRLARHLRDVPDVKFTSFPQMPNSTISARAINSLSRSIRKQFQDDPQEPSLAVLGSCLMNWNFECLMMQVYYRRHRMGADVNELVDQAHSLMDGHPVQAILLGEVLDSDNPRSDYDVLARGRSILELNMHSIANNSLRNFSNDFRIGADTREQIIVDGWASVSMFEDGMYRCFDFWSEADRTANLTLMAYYANHSAYFIEQRFHLQWETVTPEELEYWEQQCEQLPSMLWAFARHYKNRREFNASIAYYERYLAMIPDGDIWMGLAETWFMSGDDEHWLGAVEHAIQSEDYELSDAEAADMAAGTLMHAGKFAEALPWAERAAESGTYWGRTTLLDCLSALGNLDRAEEISKRMPDQAAGSTWFLWCIDYAKGDVESALELLLGSKAALPPDPKLINLPHSAAIFALSRDDIPAARRILEETGNCPLWLSLLADRQGDVARRDAIWKTLASLPPEDELQGGYGVMARVFQQKLNNPIGVVDAIMAGLTDKTRTHVNLYVASMYASMYLESRGRQEEALQLASTVARIGTRSPLRSMAWIRLRKAGIDPVLLEGRLFNRQYRRVEEMDAPHLK